MGNQVRNEELLKVFGKRLKQLRESKGLSQQELANLCDIEHSQISRIELGKINTTISTLFLIASKLEIEATELIKVKFK
ncbi:MAG: helix-turn-helix transcriptional regulator [Flavipsychrobacter sp.]|nr:helix-turn-helix transcriptional regulator [Flavipsychrobacter sp.]